MSTDKNANKSPSEKTVYVVFFSLVLDLLAFTLILPLLPSLLDYYGHHDKEGLYKVILNSVHGFREWVGAPDTLKWNSVLFGGLIGSLFSFLQFLSSPIMGAMSDVYGRRSLLLLSMVGIAGSYLLWALSSNFTLFVLARIIGGLSKGNISLSTAIVTDVSTSQNRGKGMALIGVAFSIGFIFGPMIGAGFSVWARSQEGAFYIVPALFALLLQLSDIVFVYFFFTESLPSHKRAKAIGWSDISYLINPLSLFQFSAVKGIADEDLQSMRKVGCGYFLYLLFYSGLEFTLTFLVHNKFSYTSMQQGKMFAYIGIIMALVQGGYVRRVPAGREIKVVMQGCVLIIAAFVLMGFAAQELTMYLALTLFSFASATVVPCLTTVMSRFGSDAQKGVIMGIFRSLGAFARATGPLVFSILYWSLGAEVSYLLGGILISIPLVVFSTVKIKTQ